MDNALLLAETKKLAQKESQVEQVYQLVEREFMESFLFDKERLSLKSMMISTRCTFPQLIFIMNLKILIINF